MRPRLLPRTQRPHRRARRPRRGSGRLRSGRLLARKLPRAAEIAPEAPGAEIGAVVPRADDRHADAAVERAREAGGPIDRASYSCECGYLFEAAVSTTVVCPHCGSGQAW